MRCADGRLAEDCCVTHWSPAVHGRRERATGKADCPVCRAGRAVSYWAATDWRVDWRSHCPCPRDTVAAALSSLIPCWQPARQREHERPDADALLALAERDLPASAYRIALCQMAGLSAAEARERLGLPKRTYYDAMRALGAGRLCSRRRTLLPCLPARVG